MNIDNDNKAQKQEGGKGAPNYGNSIRLPVFKTKEKKQQKEQSRNKPMAEKPGGAAPPHVKKNDGQKKKPNPNRSGAVAETMQDSKKSKTFTGGKPSVSSPVEKRQNNNKGNVFSGKPRPQSAEKKQPKNESSNKNKKPQRSEPNLPKNEKTGGQPHDTSRFKQGQKQKKAKGSSPIRVIPLGGLCEIGKNMTLLEYENDIIIVDCGVAFPEENMPGIDAVIQDYSYVVANKDRVRGIFITHGHEDHIGALPYLLRDLKCPIYGGKLTIELIRGKLVDKGPGLKGIPLHSAVAGDIIKAGNSFSIEFVRVNHSIADAFAFAIRTPAGTIFHTGDFKIDYTPIDGGPIDLQRIAQIGEEGVLLLLEESTNVEIPGNSPSEHQVGDSFQRIFKDTPGRIFIATFSSHVHRMQQIFTAAEKFDRKVALVGRSMLNVFTAANSLGYLKIRPGTVIDISEINRYPAENLVILTTGSQAEPMSALTRMAYASHRMVEIHNGDTVIISAHPIPGNEKSIYKVINELFRLGAHVIYEDLADVHVSGHAFRNELMLIHQLIKPKYFMPVHGEYRMLFRHAKLAESLGTPWENTFVLNNGDILECTQEKARVSGYVSADAVLIDGAGAVEAGNRVLQDRRLLGGDGVVSVSVVLDRKKNALMAQPNIQTIGFLFEDEAAQITQECAQKIMVFADRCKNQNQKLPGVMKSMQFRDHLRGFLFDKTKRRPLILISVIEV